MESKKCVYRTEDGKMCAAGCLLPPDYIILPHLKGKGVACLLTHTPDAILCQAFEHFQLVVDLQYVHDGTCVHKWPAELAKVADKHKLVA